MEYNFYSRYETGHRKEYIEFVSGFLSGRRSSLLSGFFSRKPFLFLMVEEFFFIFFLVAMIRSIFGCRTSGLSFRAHVCIDSKALKHRVKACFLRIMKLNKFVKVLSIVPYSACPDLEKVCDGFIEDFQFNDIDYLLSKVNQSEFSEVVQYLKNVSHGRYLVSAIGKQNQDKGVDNFVRLFNENLPLRQKYLFLIAGKVEDVELNDLVLFKKNGGLVFDRFISDSELCAIYSISDVIWCCYAASYDQSSGVLGRAIQFGKRPIVRPNSVAHKICQLKNVDSLTVDRLMLSDINLEKKEDAYLVDGNKRLEDFLNSVFAKW